VPQQERSHARAPRERRGALGDEPAAERHEALERDQRAQCGLDRQPGDAEPGGGDETDQGGTKIRDFTASSPIRVWYNTEYYKLDGTPLGNTEGRTNQSARATRLEVNNYRALSSVMAIVDARRMKGVSFGQVAAYVAMIGLAQIRPEANVVEAPSILNLFAGAGTAPPGLTSWDESFLKAVYDTRITDRAQIAAIKTAMVQDVAH